jgi:hypothetical protein
MASSARSQSVLRVSDKDKIEFHPMRSFAPRDQSVSEVSFPALISRALTVPSQTIG